MPLLDSDTNSVEELCTEDGETGVHRRADVFFFFFFVRSLC